jgi:hypothetical protein
MPWRYMGEWRYSSTPPLLTSALDVAEWSASRPYSFTKINGDRHVHTCTEIFSPSTHPSNGIFGVAKPKAIQVACLTWNKEYRTLCNGMEWNEHTVLCFMFVADFQLLPPLPQRHHYNVYGVHQGCPTGGTRVICRPQFVLWGLR